MARQKQQHPQRTRHLANGNIDKTKDDDVTGSKQVAQEKPDNASPEVVEIPNSVSPSPPPPLPPAPAPVSPRDPSLPTNKIVTRPLDAGPVPCEDGMVFEVHESSNQAYVIKHANEKKKKIGRRWQQATEKLSIDLNPGGTFSKGDIVLVTFDNGPDDFGVIKEIKETREASSPFVVVQWLYTREAAMQVGAEHIQVESWPRDRVLSNHFQVVTAENLYQIGRVTVDQQLYFDASGSKELRPLRDWVADRPAIGVGRAKVEEFGEGLKEKATLYE